MRAALTLPTCAALAPQEAAGEVKEIERSNGAVLKQVAAARAAIASVEKDSEDVSLQLVGVRALPGMTEGWGGVPGAKERTHGVAANHTSSSWPLSGCTAPLHAHSPLTLRDCCCAHHPPPHHLSPQSSLL